MPAYIWEHPGWPGFVWNADRLLTPLGEARHMQGVFLGRMREVGLGARQGSELEITTLDVVKTSAIEGEVLDPASVR